MVFLSQEFGQLGVAVLRVHLTVFGSLLLVKAQIGSQGSFGSVRMLLDCIIFARFFKDSVTSCTNSVSVRNFLKLQEISIHFCLHISPENSPKATLSQSRLAWLFVNSLRSSEGILCFMHSSNFRMSILDHRPWLSSDAIISLTSVPTNISVVQTGPQQLELLRHTRRQRKLSR